MLIEKSHTFGFEKLEVWQRSKDLVIEIYKITKSFPSEEKFGIISQINRAAISVPSNIAEGSSRKGKKDKLHFYSIAYSSLMELVSHLAIARDLEFLTEENYACLKNIIFEISNKLNALYNSQKQTTQRLNN